MSSIHSTSVATSLFWEKIDREAAKGQFYFFFLAGSGAGGIGGGQIPKIYEELRNLQSLKGGPTAGGETLQASGIATIFYPEPLSKADVQQLLKVIPSPEDITSKSDSDSFLVRKGYVTRDDFLKRLMSEENSNPVAAYAIFDALSKGSATFVSPDQMEEAMTKYRDSDGLSAFATDLQTAAVTKISAYSLLAFLLLFVLDLIVETGINAFL